MAIQRRTHGVATAWTTSQPIPFSTVAAAGDCCYLMALNTQPIGTAPSGWTEIATGGPAAGYYLKIFRMDVTYSGTPTAPTVTAIGGAGGVAWIEHYYSDVASTTLSAVAQVGVDTDTTTTAFSAAGTSITTLAGDLLVAALGLKTSASMTAAPSAIVLTQAGATMGTQVGNFGTRLASSSPTNSLHYGGYQRPVTTGGTGAPSMTATAGTGGTTAGGPVGLMRLRETVAATNYTATPGDTVGITDGSAQQAVDYGYAFGDPEAITDSAAPSLGAVRSSTDSVGLTDSATAVLSTAAAPADPVGIADAASSALLATRAASDPVGLTDSATDVLTADRTAPDAVGISDSATANLVLGGTAYTADLADPVGLTDGDSDQTLVLDDTAPDAVGITDAAAAAAVSTRAQGDPVGLADSATFSTDAARGPVDGAGITDAITVVMSRVVTVADFLALTDGTSVDFAGAGLQNLGDPTGITDAASSSAVLPRSTADPVGLQDGAVAVLSRVVASPDALAIGDALTALSTAQRTAADLASITDSVVAELVNVEIVALRILRHTARIPRAAGAARIARASGHTYSTETDHATGGA